MMRRNLGKALIKAKKRGTRLGPKLLNMLKNEEFVSPHFWAVDPTNQEGVTNLPTFSVAKCSALSMKTHAFRSFGDDSRSHHLVDHPTW